MELVIKQQAAQELAERFKDLLHKRVAACVENGLDWGGLHIANVVLAKGIEQRIATGVGNYLRVNEMSVRVMILREIEKQLPEIVRNSVQGYAERAAKKLLETIKVS